MQWLDQQRFVVMKYRAADPQSGGFAEFDAAVLVDETGAEVARSNLPELTDVRVLAQGQLVHTTQAVYDVSTGATVWSTGKSALRGAANLAHFVYAERGRVKIVAYR